MSRKTTFVLASAVSALAISVCASAADHESHSKLGTQIYASQSTSNAATGGIVGSGAAGIVGSGAAGIVGSGAAGIVGSGAVRGGLTSAR